MSASANPSATAAASSAGLLSSAPTAAASAATASSKKNAGRLRMTILSAYDLPDREPPVYIQLDIGHGENKKTVHTGPPVQRHKDRNSFKFHSHKMAAPSSGELLVETPTLAELYRETAVLTVVYTNPLKTQYTASYSLNQLLISETTWLILNLQPVSNDSHTSDEAEQHAAASAPEQTPQQQQPSLLPPSAVKTGSSMASDDDDVPPTLRLQMTLEGPFRTEIAALVQLVKAWLALVDDIEHKWTTQLAPFLPSLPPVQWLLVPTAPLVAVFVVSTPILVGLALVFFPLVLPLVAVCVVLGTALFGGGAFLYASTQEGRKQVIAMCQPVQHTLLHTQTGQSFVYALGPRPSPVSLCRQIFPEGPWGKLALSLWIDFVGSASYLLPLVGEGLDVAWAPLQTIFIMALYCPDENGPPGSTVLPYLSFVEEILPFTDVVCSATLGWMLEFAVPLFFVPPTANGASHRQGTSTVPGSNLRDALATKQQ